MSARANPNMTLRPFLPQDTPLLAEIFRASVMELTGDDYTESQQEAWVSAADDEETFGARLANQLTLVGLLDGSPVGFASLEGAGHIDMLYVHPAAADHGVGGMLYDALEKLAAARKATRLTTDASDNAQDFFRRRGFKPQRRNSIPMGDEWLANTTMEKTLVEKAEQR
jgi:putative acetyltransferase